MRAVRSLLFLFASGIAAAQTVGPRAIPELMSLSFDDGAVSVVHLSPGYSTSIRFPEEIRSVVIGNPASFKAEHSEAQPRLVFLKPIINQPAETNALISTKSGREVSLHLVSAGDSAHDTPVDFMVEYRRQQSFIVDSGGEVFAVPETERRFRSTAEVQPRAGWISKELERQKAASISGWRGTDLRAAIGDSVHCGHQTAVAFSVLNNSATTIELLPPQIQLSGAGMGRKAKFIKAEPVAITDYRLTLRRLAAGQRADGIVVFERPAFKESGETLKLRLAQAEQIDRPILLSLPFSATREVQ